ncbi:MAG: hypothetical protein V4463_00715 [Pseudomonadota bacterium]
MNARLKPMETALADLPAAVLRTDLRVAELRVEIQKQGADIIKWVIGTSLAIAALLLTVIFALNNANSRQTAAAPVAALPPIVINVPPSPSAARQP